MKMQPIGPVKAILVKLYPAIELSNVAFHQPTNSAHFERMPPYHPSYLQLVRSGLCSSAVVLVHQTLAQVNSTHQGGGDHQTDTEHLRNKLELLTLHVKYRTCLIFQHISTPLKDTH